MECLLVVVQYGLSLLQLQMSSLYLGCNHVFQWHMIKTQVVFWFNEEEGFMNSRKIRKAYNLLTSQRIFLNKVEENKERYTNRYYDRVIVMRKIQNKLGQPSMRTYLKVVKNNLLPNCPINWEGVLVAEDVLGPNVGALKVKTVATRTNHWRLRLFLCHLKWFKNINRSLFMWMWCTSTR